MARQCSAVSREVTYVTRKRSIFALFALSFINVSVANAFINSNRSLHNRLTLKSRTCSGIIVRWHIMQTKRQRLKLLFIFLIAVILLTIATFSYFGSHYLSIKSSTIRGVTDVEERHYYNIHSWQGKSAFKNSHSVLCFRLFLFPVNSSSVSEHG